MVHLPGFLSIEEVTELRDRVEAARESSSVATVERGTDGLQQAINKETPIGL